MSDYTKPHYEQRIQTRVDLLLKVTRLLCSDKLNIDLYKTYKERFDKLAKQWGSSFENEILLEIHRLLVLVKQKAMGIFF